MTNARETAGLTTRLILDHVEAKGGAPALEVALAHPGVRHDRETLRDTSRWFSYDEKVALFEGAEAALGDPDVATHVGAAALTTSVLSRVVPLLQAFGGPAPLLRQVARAQRRFSTAAEMEALEVGRTRAVVGYRVLPPNQAHRHDCAYTVGILRQVGPIFGLPPASVVHGDGGCQAEGAERCRYEVTWQRGSRWRRRGRELRDEALAAEAADAIDDAERRLETAGALLRLSRSLADLSTVEETAQRVAEATVDAVGCDTASVLLWDAEDRVFTVHGAAGYPEDDEADVWRSRIVPEDGDGFPALDVPRLVTREEATGELARLLDRFGLARTALVPLRSRRRLLGAMTAGWRTDGVVLDPHLDTRLESLADQAATALENARLLETVQRQAMHDGLTGLPNQTLFADRVRHGLARARRTGEELALGVLDLDRFKTVNDSLGHAVGDELLVEVGRRLRASVREVDSVARMGGDEFTLLLPGADAYVAAEHAAERVLAAFDAPFEVGGHILRMTPSLGFALHPGHGDELDDLLKRADVAMYQAKAAGRNTWATYTSGMSERAYDRLTLEADLFRAVQSHELRVAYQPVVRLSDGRVVGAEALVRWAHPSLGLLAPDEFLPIAEEVGLVAEIDGWVLRQACLDLGRAQATDSLPARVAVNVSGRSLTHPALRERVADALMAGGIRPHQLLLEVTETVTVEEAGGVVEALAELRQMGVRIAVDDFGRGQSALSRLDQLPMDQLKVDKAFLRGVTSPDDDAPVVSAIIAMGQGLGLEVLAEGVERPEQLAFLRSRGCDLAQGYLFGRPTIAPLSEVLALVPGEGDDEG